LTVKKNCVVTLDYTIFDTNNTLLDSGSQPLIYLHGGYNEVFYKIEKALEGKSIGDSIHLQLLPKDAFGEYQSNLVLVQDRNMFEDNLEVGQHVEMVFSEDENEEIMLVYAISDIQEDRVVLDANHPLAGITIMFDATVIGLREATADEIEAKLHHTLQVNDSSL